MSRRQRDFIGPQGMAGMVSLWGAASVIRSVQYGTVALGTSNSATATIASVNIANSVLFLTGATSNNGGSTLPTSMFARVSLTNATTVTADRAAATGVTESVGFCVIEFAPGLIKSIQSGTIALNGVASNTATITRVNTASTLVTCLGSSTAATVDTDAYAYTTLTDGVTVTATRSGTAAVLTTVGYQVVEFY